MSLLINGDDNHITRSRAGGDVLDQAADINVQGVVGGICQNQLDISAFGLAGGVGHNRARLNHHILRNVDSRANGNAILHELVDSSIVAGLLRLLHSVAGNLDVHSLILDVLHHAVDLNGLQHVGLCASIFQSLNTSSNSVALGLSFLCELLQVLQAGQLFLIVCHIVIPPYLYQALSVENTSLSISLTSESVAMSTAAAPSGARSPAAFWMVYEVATPSTTTERT